MKLKIELIYHIIYNINMSKRKANNELINERELHIKRAFEYLLNNKEVIRNSILKSASEGNFRMLKFLIDNFTFQGNKSNKYINNKIDINLVTDKDENNILHLAVQNENQDCIRYILSFNDFLINEENTYNENALDILVLDKIANFDFTKKNIGNLFDYIINIKLILKFYMDNTLDNKYDKYFNKINNLLEYTKNDDIEEIYSILLKIFKNY